MLKFPAAHAENVRTYITACISLKWCITEPFDVVDVIEMHDMDKVVRHLLQVHHQFYP
jgi:hypothetical protein